MRSWSWVMNIDCAHTADSTQNNGVWATSVSQPRASDERPNKPTTRHRLVRRSVPIDVGRSKRLATVRQRRALEAIHPTCAIPDCEVIFDHCNVHHIDYWENGGSTDLNNMIPLCSRHHHAAHEGGWKLKLDSETRELAIR